MRATLEQRAALRLRIKEGMDAILDIVKPEDKLVLPGEARGTRLPRAHHQQHHRPRRVQGRYAAEPLSQDRAGREEAA